MKFKKRRQLSLVLTVILAIGRLAVPVYADEYKSGDVFIGTDGSQMSATHSKQWRYTVNGDHIELDRYLGGFTSDGSIIGVMPATINDLPVESLWGTFTTMTQLKKPPVIPSTAKSLFGTFQDSGITKPPVIPSGVTHLVQTFMGCPITDAPSIPSTVISMTSTFTGSKITKAPTLPNGLISMGGSFANCYSLTEAPIIPEKVIDMDMAFYKSGVKTASPIPDSVSSILYTYGGCKLTTKPTFKNISGRNSSTLFSFLSRSCNDRY